MTKKLLTINEVTYNPDSMILVFDLTKHKENFYLPETFEDIIRQYTLNVMGDELSNLLFELTTESLTMKIMCDNPEDIRNISNYILGLDLLMYYLSLYIVDLKIHVNVLKFLDSFMERNL